MNSRTAERLIAINKAFYSAWAGEFDATRRSPWPGWQRVLDEVGGARELSILDVGCGNGRFGRFAESRPESVIEYWGVDTSARLLSAAREAGAGDSWTLVEADVVSRGSWPVIEGRDYDLVVCFGVMHHVPGETNRRALIERMAARVAVGGCLAVSFWQFGRGERFRRRVLPWSEYDPGEGEPVDTADLEPGDYLLRWGERDLEAAEGVAPVRYCHYCGPEEAKRLTGDLDVAPVATFSSDGRSGDLNLYHLLRRRESREESPQ